MAKNRMDANGARTGTCRRRTTASLLTFIHAEVLDQMTRVIEGVMSRRGALKLLLTGAVGAVTGPYLLPRRVVADLQRGKSEATLSEDHLDISTPVGTWYLLANDARLELMIQGSNNGLVGTVKHEGDSPDSLSHVTWDPTGRWLEFRRKGHGFYQCYRVSLSHGMLAGRLSHALVSSMPTRTDYALHVTGWSPTWLDLDIVPRTWNVTIDGNLNAVLRIDLDTTGILAGRLKVYDDSSISGVQEELENDLMEVAWDGTSISFIRRGPGFTQTYRGKAEGRFIRGTFTQGDGAPTQWGGARGEILGFGLGSRLAQHAAWQVTTRARIFNLTEGMSASGEAHLIAVENLGPVATLTGGGFPPERDDDPNASSPNYTLQR